MPVVLSESRFRPSARRALAQLLSGGTVRRAPHPRQRPEWDHAVRARRRARDPRDSWARADQQPRGPVLQQSARYPVRPVARSQPLPRVHGPDGPGGARGRQHHPRWSDRTEHDHLREPARPCQPGTSQRLRATRRRRWSRVRGGDPMRAGPVRRGVRRDRCRPGCRGRH